MKINRGDVFLIDLGVNLGSEQNGIRPCVVVQNNVGNEYSPITIICPMTTKNKSSVATHVELQFNGKQALVLCEQVRAVDKSRLFRKVGVLSTQIMQAVGESIKSTLSIE